MNLKDLLFGGRISTIVRASAVSKTTDASLFSLYSTEKKLCFHYILQRRNCSLCFHYILQRRNCSMWGCLELELISTVVKFDTRINTDILLQTLLNYRSYQHPHLIKYALKESYLVIN